MTASRPGCFCERKKSLGLSLGGHNSCPTSWAWTGMCDPECWLTLPGTQAQDAARSWLVLLML